jgi:hypothetical protein
MNRRDALRSLLTLPVAATTIERSPAAPIQGQSIGFQGIAGQATAWDAPYGSTPKIAWTDFTKGKGPQLRVGPR